MKNLILILLTALALQATFSQENYFYYNDYINPRPHKRYQITYSPGGEELGLAILLLFILIFLMEGIMITAS